MGFKPKLEPTTPKTKKIAPNVRVDVFQSAKNAFRTF
tara:strand:+ start:160 stop:270 length:111 start_codon:yes stop_codon:yes gene_type:complete